MTRERESHLEWHSYSQTACLVACGGTHSFAGLLVARFFQGVGGCMYIPPRGKKNPPEKLTIYTATFSTMVGGVISDIYHAEDRNTPMALFSGSALFGTGLAPLLAGVIVTHTSWRWVYYSHAIVSGAFVIVIFFFFKETRGSVLLSRKALKLNRYYEQLEETGHVGVILSSEESPEEKAIRRIRWKVKSDEQRASLLKMIQISLYRPFRKCLALDVFLAEMCDTDPPDRYARHRARRLLFLPLGVFQLGHSLPAIQFHPAGLPD